MSGNGKFAPFVLTRRATMAGLLACAWPASSFMSGKPLKDPFSPFRQRKSAALVDCSAGGKCPSDIPPMHDLEGVRFYTDPPRNSHVSEKRLAANLAANRPLADFTAAVQAQNCSWLASEGKNHDAALCGLDLLRSWARSGALLGRFNGQAQATRRFYLTGISAAYLALRHALDTGSDMLVEISGWLEKVALKCAEAEHRLHNNHLYWLGAGVSACAIANDNRALFERALAMARRGLDDIQPNGSLPRELARGPRALLYHSFAISPLLFTAELALANGIDLYAENDQALRRLTEFFERNLKEDSTEIEHLTGTKQIWTGATDNTLPWVEIASRRFPDPRIKRSAEHLRPINYTYLGGNVTLLFGP